MKAYTDLAQELGESENTGVYVSKMKSSSSKRISPGGSRHFRVDHTGRSHIATRKLPKTISEGSYEQISNLLSQGANPKTSDSKGRTPLHFAAVRGQVDIVQSLISHGALVNEQDNIGNTPLHLACVGGHVGVVTTLLRAGTNLMMTDTRGSTPLHLALSRLRMLDTRSALRQTTPNNHRKREVEKIIEMIREYLRLRSENNDIDDDSDDDNGDRKKKDIDELDVFTRRLNLSENNEQVDEISSLLLNFTELSIQKDVQKNHPSSVQ